MKLSENQRVQSGEKIGTIIPVPSFVGFDTPVRVYILWDGDVFSTAYDPNSQDIKNLRKV